MIATTNFDNVLMRQCESVRFLTNISCVCRICMLRADLADQAVDETQERLEMLGVELDDMCRRLGLGDSFQV